MAEREVISRVNNIKGLDQQPDPKPRIEGKGLSCAGANPLTFPRIISEWDRNKREVIRVELDHYNGRHIVGIRVWYRDGEALKPSRSGLTVSVKHLAPLATALSLALNAAEKAGLLGEGGDA